MKVVRKVMGAIDTVLDVIFMVGVRPAPKADWPTKDAAVGTSVGPDTGLYGKGFLYMTHEERGKTLQADHEDRRRREQFGW